MAHPGVRLLELPVCTHRERSAAVAHVSPQEGCHPPAHDVEFVQVIAGRVLGSWQTASETQAIDALFPGPEKKSLQYDEVATTPIVMTGNGGEPQIVLVPTDQLWLGLSLPRKEPTMRSKVGVSAAYSASGAMSSM